MIAELIQRNRVAMEEELAGRAWRRYFSPVLYTLDASLTSVFRHHATGRLLDVGCGKQPYRKQLEALAVYESIDLRRNSDSQTFVGDVQSMPAVTSCQYDTIVCSEVLEHVPEPAAALSDLRRVLKPSGKLLLSVPFLSRLHEEPYDYYRFTRHGLMHLLRQQGFEVVELDAVGSLFSFFGHQLSTVLVCCTWHIAGLRWIILALNSLLITLPSYSADRLLGSEKLPLSYVVVARRMN